MGIGEGVAMPAMNKTIMSRLSPLGIWGHQMGELASRAIMGIGESVAMPAMNNIMSSGMFIGSIIGLSLSPQMIEQLGWQSVFYVFGSTGVFWYFTWQKLSHSTPREDPNISEGEVAYIEATTISRKEGPVKIPWKELLSRKEVWAIIVCHFCHNWGTFILLTWMPSYYSQELGLDLMHSGIYSVLPWITMAITANLGGWIADTLISKGYSITNVRKLSHIDTVQGAVLCMMGAQGLDAFSQSGLYSNHQDIAPRYSGVLLGMSNTAGVLAGVLGSLATGYILQNGSWDEVWDVSIGLYLVGTVIWNLFSTGERIID
eukprot:gene12429-15628_t